MALLHPDNHVHALILLGQHKGYDAAATAAAIAVGGVVVADGIERKGRRHLQGSPIVLLDTGLYLHLGVTYHPGESTTLGKDIERFGPWGVEGWVGYAVLS